MLREGSEGVKVSTRAVADALKQARESFAVSGFPSYSFPLRFPIALPGNS
jgi:hypothetical protein